MMPASDYMAYLNNHLCEIEFQTLLRKRTNENDIIKPYPFRIKIDFS